MTGNAEGVSAHVDLHPVCIVCNGTAGRGASLRNNNGTFTRVCESCFERLWHELYQDSLASTKAGTAMEQEGRSIC